MIEDADCVYDFILSNFENISESDIFLLGRSMGSGPCIYLGSNRNPGAIILMSAFKNIKSVVYENFYFLSSLVSEQFDNLKLVSKI